MSCVKGSTLTEAHRRKIGNAHRGMRRSAQARRNISRALKGRKLTKAWKKNLATSHRQQKTERRAIAHFERQGYRVVRHGWPDLLLIKRKTFRFVEIKRRADRNHLRAAQVAMHDALRSVGMSVEIWFPKDGAK